MDDITNRLLRELPKAILGWYPFNSDGRALLISHGKELLDIYEEMLLTAGLNVDAFLLRDYEAILPKERYVVSSVHADEGNSAVTDDIGGIDNYVADDVIDESITDISAIISSDYDYVIILDAFEYMKRPVITLSNLNSLLNDNGIMLIGMDNRLGLRYFCGDRDIFTDRNFDGIDGYSRINRADWDSMAGRAYSRAEAMELLSEAGISESHSFSVLPCVEEPQLIYAEDYLPEEAMNTRFNSHYNYPDSIFLEENNLYASIIQNGMFHQMANGYLVECAKSVGGCVAFETCKHLTISMERGEENSLATIIKRDGTVVKKAVYPAGEAKLRTLIDNDNYLRAHGINVIDSCLEGNEYIMPYVVGQPATEYFRSLLVRSTRDFIRELRRFFEIILKSSEYAAYDDIDWYHYAPGNEKQKADDPNYDKWYKIAHGDKPEALGKIMKKGFIDLVTLNCFVVNGEFVFYDQEFTVDNLPAYTILWRSIELIYRGNIRYHQILPLEEVFRLLDMDQHANFYASFSHDFIGRLRHWKELRQFHRDHEANGNLISANRQRTNYSQEDYQRLFIDLFRNVEGRKIFVFGSGNYARKFLSQFGDDYDIAGILDNSRAKWGEYLENIEIMNPDILSTLTPNEYKVIICIKNYIPVMKQLKALGATNYSLYDWSLEYKRETTNKTTYADINAGKTEAIEKKPYHIGYIAGVFDLFHIGHLNLLKRAKSQCDYLIVGVVSDEGVIRDKKTSPYIPFVERLEIVQSCQYVDEAVEIPADYCDSDEAYRRYQFDVQFSGSDYADDPDWLDKQAYLRKKGSDLVFFPYTQSTSSTKLKAVIAANKALLKAKKEEESGVGKETETEIKSAINIEGDEKMEIAFMTNPAMEPHRPNQGLDIHKDCSIGSIIPKMSDFISGEEIRRYGQTVITTDVQRYEKVSDNVELLWKYGMEYVRLCKEKGLNIPAIMAPYKARDTKRGDLDEFLFALACESIHLCKDAGAGYVIIQPNSYNQSDIDKVTSWYDRLVPLAKESGVSILVANQCKDVSGHLVRGIFSDPEELACFIDEQNAKHGEGTFGVCVDVGIYNICGQRMQDEVVALGDRIKTVIITENDGHHDSRMLQYTCATDGSDDMDFTGLIRGLRAIDFDGLLILDMFNTVAAVPTKLRGGMVKLGKEFMDFLAWQIGMEKGLKRYSQRVLFGAGNMCRAYMKCYGEEFPPLYTCDNNAKMWGTDFCGLTVKNPEELMELPEDCVIYICNMYYNEIESQLREMGVTNPIEFFNDEYMPSYHFTRI